VGVYLIKSVRGGISDEEDKGIRGSFKNGRSLDIHKKRDSLSCQQAMKKESGSTVTDLILFIVPCSDGNSYHFGDTGKIYKRTAAGVWSLKYTDANGKIKGAAEYNNYLYWATNTKLARKPIPGADGWLDVNNIWNNLTAADWHTMIAGPATAGIQGGHLFICNSDKVAMVDNAGIFTSEAVKLTPDVRAKALIDNDEWLIIGTTKADSSEEGYLFAWNVLIMNWKKRKRIPMKGINGLVISEIMIAQVGEAGELFFSDLVSQFPITAFPGGKVNPGGVTTKGNLAMFGVFGGSNPGIYSYGRTKKNRVFALNLDYILTPTTIDEIGAVKMVGSDLLVSWKSGNTYGVDVVDLANKAIAIYEGLDWDGERPDLKKLFEQIIIQINPLPTGCSIKMKYRLDKKGDWIAAKLGDGTETFNIVNATEAIFNIGNEGTIYEVKAELYPSGNNTPEIFNIKNYFTSREEL
jgi:hypothetical protein